jgi:plastocyanin
MRRALLAAGAAAGLLTAAAPATAMPVPETTPVTMAFAAFAPGQTRVLVGDTVHWANTSARTHTVTSDAAGFDSGDVLPRGSYDRSFGAPGVVAYRCRLHSFMRGEIDVRRVLIQAPPAGVLGARVVLRGRSAADGPVRIEAATAAGWQPVGTATPGRHGDWTLPVAPRASTRYRAAVAGETTAPVTVRILDRRVAVSRRRGRRATVVRAHVVPARPHGRVVLELRLRDRFGWWPVRRGRLDARSRASFRLGGRVRAPARVRLVLPDWATPLATSRVLGGRGGHHKAGPPHGHQGGG